MATNDAMVVIFVFLLAALCAWAAIEVMLLGPERRIANERLKQDADTLKRGLAENTDLLERVVAEMQHRFGEFCLNPAKTRAAVRMFPGATQCLVEDGSPLAEQRLQLFAPVEMDGRRWVWVRADGVRDAMRRAGCEV